jgi:polar amino acid transport system substrate-binding protein
LAALLGAALLAACATQPEAPTPEIRRILAPTGKLRVGVYPGSPTSMTRSPASGEVAGVSVDLGRELAQRLGVSYEQVEYQRIAEVIEGLKTGAVDFTVTNATPARAREIDFTQPLLAIELGYLVPARSTVSSIAELDRAGVNIGVTQGSTSESTLPRELKSAKVVPAPTLKAGAEMLSQGKLDAFATNKAILFEMSDGLPGSRILEGRWGVEHLAIAIPKGRDDALPYLRHFVDDVDSTRLVARAAERAGLRGVARPSSR